MDFSREGSQECAVAEEDAVTSPVEAVHGNIEDEAESHALTRAATSAETVDSELSLRSDGSEKNPSTPFATGDFGASVRLSPESQAKQVERLAENCEAVNEPAKANEPSASGCVSRVSEGDETRGVSSDVCSSHVSDAVARELLAHDVGPMDERLVDGNHLNEPECTQSSRKLDEPSPQTLRAFANYVMGVESFPSGSVDEDFNDAWSIAPKRRGVYNLVQVPMRLERLIVFCCCICVDEFLHLFTLLPLRCVVAAFRILLFCVAQAGRSVRSFLRLRSPSAPAPHEKLWLYSIATVIDWMHMSIFVFTSIVLGSFDISSVYHSIRGQSVIKLYVVFNVMEIFDRLCCSFGVDIMDSLGWTTANAVNYFNSKRQAARVERRDAESAVRSRPFRGFVLLTRVTVDYLFVLVYVCVHASLLLIWVVTLNVAINTQNNALLTLLVSNNFVELKGAVFKNYKVQNLFQISCADAVERFQLTLFLGVMLVYAEGDRQLVLTWALIFSCEVIVDWIKHAFVTKFNRIPYRAYQQFSMVICHDVVHAKRNSAVRSIGGTGVAKRIGFVSLPLGALVVRMSVDCVARLPVVVPCFLFLIMLALKMSLSMGLLGHASRRVNPQATRGDQDVNASALPDDDEAWYKSLANVGRYDKS